MSEQTALFLANLSHKWFLAVLSLPVVLGVTAYYTGAIQVCIRADAICPTRTRRGGKVIRGALCALLAVSIAIFGVAFFHVGCASLMAHSTQCMSNEKQLAMGILMYSQDYDEQLPASTRWSEAIYSRVKKVAKSTTDTGRDPFRCPAAESPASYGMNAALGDLVVCQR